LKNRENAPPEDEIPDIVASYQEAIVDVLVEKTIKAADECNISRIVVSGGVASNSRLREKFYQEALKEQIEVFIPPPVLCTDNAAMVAVVGSNLLEKGKKDSFDLNAVSRWPLDSPNK
jgi:N6-L-threonylcarbamoyladenine synthase